MSGGLTSGSGPIVNDFLALGVGSGANVITQGEYAGLPARNTGFQAGIARSA